MSPLQRYSILAFVWALRSISLAEGIEEHLLPFLREESEDLPSEEDWELVCDVLLGLPSLYLDPQPRIILLSMIEDAKQAKPKACFLLQMRWSLFLAEGIPVTNGLDLAHEKWYQSVTHCLNDEKALFAFLQAVDEDSLDVPCRLFCKWLLRAPVSHEERLAFLKEALGFPFILRQRPLKGAMARYLLEEIIPPVFFVNEWMLPEEKENPMAWQTSWENGVPLNQEWIALMQRLPRGEVELVQLFGMAMQEVEGWDTQKLLEEWLLLRTICLDSQN